MGFGATGTRRLLGRRTGRSRAQERRFLGVAIPAGAWVGPGGPHWAEPRDWRRPSSVAE